MSTISSQGRLPSQVQVSSSKEAPALQIRSPLQLTLVCAMSTLPSFVIGYCGVVLSQTEGLMRERNNYTEGQIRIGLTVVVSAFNLGEIVGPLLYSYVSDKYGERGAIIRLNFLTILSLLIQLVDLSIPTLLVGRLLLGLCMGLTSSITPMYVHSISPLSMSGRMGAINQWMIGLGLVSAYSLGYGIREGVVGRQGWWRVVVGFPIIGCIANSVGMWLWGFDKIQRHIQKGQLHVLERYVNFVYTNATVQDIIKEKTLEEPKPGRVQHEDHHIYRYVVAMLVIAANQFSGINSIFYYSPQLFSQITASDPTLTQHLMLALACCQLLSTSAAGKWIDSYGRKWLMMRGQMGLIGVLIAIWIVDGLQVYIGQVIALIFMHVIIFNFTLGPVCIVYATELVADPTPILLTLRLCSFLVAISTHQMLFYWGLGRMFLLFAFLTGVSCLILKNKMKQTKGMGRNKIYLMFDQNHQQSESASLCR